MIYGALVLIGILRNITYLFKNQFGDGIEQKIVESAIVFQFKNADCKAENKVVEY